MNHVTGFLISPRRPPPRPFGQPGATFSFLSSPFFSKWLDRPRNAQTTHSPGRCFLGPFMPPGHYLPPPQRLPAASFTIDLLGRRTRRLPLERKGKGGRGLTPRHRRQAAPLVSAVHGCYKHSADDERVITVVNSFCVSVHSLITCIFSPPR